MAKGQIAKLEVAAKIIEAFGDNAFLYNDGKEVRVNTVENGEPVQYIVGNVDFYGNIINVNKTINQNVLKI